MSEESQEFDRDFRKAVKDSRTDFDINTIFYRRLQEMLKENKKIKIIIK